MKETTKMKKANKLIDLYVLVTLLLSAGSITLRTVAHFLEYNDITKHFNDKTLFSISAWLSVGAVLFAATFCLCAREKIDLAAASNTPLTYIPSGILTVALVFMGFGALTNIREFSSPALAVLKYLSIGISLFAFAAAVFFFFNVLSMKRESLYKSILCICVVIFLTIYSAYIYFNKQTLPTNAPAKIIDLMAHLFSAIFFVYETRITLGRALWKPYIIFGLITASLCAYSAIPSIILYIARGEILSLSITESILTLTLFIFSLSRVCLTKYLPAMEKCKAATLVTSHAESREEQLAKLRMFYAAANAPVASTEEIHEEESESLAYESDTDLNQETINIDEYTLKKEEDVSSDEETGDEEN